MDGSYIGYLTGPERNNFISSTQCFSKCTFLSNSVYNLSLVSLCVIFFLLKHGCINSLDPYFIPHVQIAGPGLYRTVQDYTGLYITIQDYTGPLRMIHDFTELYRK